jgi:TRAP-type C4-dicarboxylate transport system substrate-binding protein
MINCAASTPFGAVGFQWYTKFKYMSSNPTTNILGATFITKEVWDKISPSGQKILMEVSARSHDKLMKVTRDEDTRSVVLLKKSGVTIVPTDLKNKDQQFVIEVGKKVRENLVGKLYTRELLDKTLALTEEYRRTHPMDTTVIRLE